MFNMLWPLNALKTIYPNHTQSNLILWNDYRKIHNRYETKESLKRTNYLYFNGCHIPDAQIPYHKSRLIALWHIHMTLTRFFDKYKGT